MDANQIVTYLKLDDKDFKFKLGDTQKEILKISAVGATFTATMLGMAAATASYQDEQIKASRTAGVAVETYSALAGAASYAGVSNEALTKSLTKLSAPTADMTKKMSALGVSVTDASGKAKTGDVLFSELADSIKNLKNPADQAAATFSVFGEEGAKMVNLLKDGSEGLDTMKEKMMNLGLVVSESAGKNAELFNDNVQELTDSVKGLGFSIGETIIEFVNQSNIVTTLASGVQKLTSFWRNMDDGTKELIMTIGGAVAAGTLLAGSIGAIVGIVSVALAALSPLVITIGAIGAAVGLFAMTVIKYWDQIKSVTIPLVNAWDSLKASAVSLFSTISRIVQPLIDSVKEITGLGENSKEASEEISILGSVAKFAFSIITTSVAIVIRQMSGFIDLINFSITAIKELAAAGKALASGDFAKAGEAAKRSWEATKAAGTTVITTFRDVKNLLVGLAKDDYKVKVIAETKTAVQEISVLRKELEKEIPKSAEKGLKDTSTEFEKSVKKWKDMFNDVQTSWNQLSFTPNGIGNFGMAVSKMVDQTAQAVAKGLEGVSKLAELNAEKMKRSATMQSLFMNVFMKKIQEQNQKEIAEAEKAEEMMLESMRASEERKLELLRQSEEARLNQIRGYQNERSLLLNQEYQTEKERREAEFQAFLASERARFEQEKLFLDEKALDRETRIAIQRQMDADWLAYQAMLQQDHEQAMLDLQKEYGDKEKKNQAEDNKILEEEKLRSDATIESAEMASNAAIEKAEEESNKKLEQLKADKEAQEKQHAKNMAFIQWATEASILESTKNIQAIQTTVQGVASAAQAFSALASIPFVGIPLGLAASATILAATAQSVNMIRSQFVPPPAELFLEKGGVLKGASHSQGGIKAELEGDEGVLDANRTNKFIDMHDAVINGQMGSITIYIQPGAIQGFEMNEAGLNKVALYLARRIQREKIV